MIKENNSLLRRTQLFFDLSITAASFVIASHVREVITPDMNGLWHKYVFLLYFILPVWAMLLHYNKVYHPIRTLSFFSTAWSSIKTTVLGGAILATFLFIFKVEGLSRGFILLFISVNTVLFIIERAAIYVFFHYIRKRGFNFRNVLVIGTGDRARRFAETIDERPEWGLKIAGFVDKDEKMTGRMLIGRRVLGALERIEEILAANTIDIVVFVGPRSWLDEIEKIIIPCESIGVQMHIACDFYPNTLSKMSFGTMGNWPLLAFMPPPHYGEFIWVKRAIDIGVSAFALILTMPLLLVISFAIKYTSPGPVLFRQKRCGLNGRVFELLKFRTMVDNAETLRSEIQHMNEMSGPVFKTKNDPRITRVGSFLRKFSLDELPQFINVFNGDMSVVGPRPPLPSEVEKYDYNQRRRLSVKPGITCIWQVEGRNKVGFSDWVKLDLEYIDKWSLGLDLKIILKTIPAVFKGTGQ